MQKALQARSTDSEETASHVSDEKRLMLVTTMIENREIALRWLVNKLQNVMFSNTRHGLHVFKQRFTSSRRQGSKSKKHEEHLRLKHCYSSFAQ